VQSLLLLFGVWLVIRNLAYLLFTGDDQAVRTSYSTASVPIFGSSFSVNRVVVFVISLWRSRCSSCGSRGPTPVRRCEG
jgi:branched-chain amino acid transport system permease protein